MANHDQEEKTKMNPILWFFFAIVIPIIVAITITFIVLTIAGVDASGWMKDKAAKLPLVSSLVSDSDKKENAANEKSDLQIQESLDAKNKQIDDLKAQISELEGTVDDLEQQVVKEKNKQKSAENAQDEQNTSASAGGQTPSASGQSNNQAQTQGKTTPVKKMASSFRKMDANQAALIVEDLPNDMAIDLLNELSTDARGQILQSMDSKKAAQLTEKFIKSEE